jgi:hypothetical protein
MAKVSVGWATPAFFGSGQSRPCDFAWLLHAHAAQVVDENGHGRSWGQLCRDGDVIGCSLTIEPVSRKALISYSRNRSWAPPMG